MPQLTRREARAGCSGSKVVRARRKCSNPARARARPSNANSTPSATRRANGQAKLGENAASSAINRPTSTINRGGGRRMGELRSTADIGKYRLGQCRQAVGCQRDFQATPPGADMERPILAQVGSEAG